MLRRRRRRLPPRPGLRPLHGRQQQQGRRLGLCRAQAMSAGWQRSWRLKLSSTGWWPAARRQVMRRARWRSRRWRRRRTRAQTTRHSTGRRTSRRGSDAMHTRKLSCIVVSLGAAATPRPAALPDFDSTQSPHCPRDPASCTAVVLTTTMLNSSSGMQVHGSREAQGPRRRSIAGGGAGPRCAGGRPPMPQSMHRIGTF